MNLTYNNRALYRVGLWKLINDGLNDIQADWQKIVPNTAKSRQAYEQIQTHSGLAFFQDMSEAEGVYYDTIQKGYEKTFTPVIRTLGIRWSKQSKQKDIYGFIKSQAPMLAEAAVATRNLLAANLLSNGFSSSGTVTPDAVSQFNSAHPLKTGGTFSNVTTNALTGPNLEAGIQSVRSQVGDRGIPKYYRGGFKLVVGSGLAGRAHRVARSAGLAGTADNDTNSWISGNIKEIVEDPMLDFGSSTLSENWYLIPANSKDSPFINVEVQGLETDDDYDMDHQMYKMAANFECVYDTLGWRGTYGANLG